MKTTFIVSDSPYLAVEELSAATGEPAERLQELRSLGLIRPDAGERFASEDIERVRLVQFLERRQIPLETIAHGERDEALLTTVVGFLYPRASGGDIPWHRRSTSWDWTPTLLAACETPPLRATSR